MCEYIVLVYKCSNVCGHMCRYRCMWVNISVKVQLHSPSYIMSERLSLGPQLSDSAHLLTDLSKPKSPHVHVKYFTHWTISPGLYVYLNRLLKHYCSPKSYEFWHNRFCFKWHCRWSPLMVLCRIHIFLGMSSTSEDSIAIPRGPMEGLSICSLG